VNVTLIVCLYASIVSIFRVGVFSLLLQTADVFFAS